MWVGRTIKRPPREKEMEETIMKFRKVLSGIIAGVAILAIGCIPVFADGDVARIGEQTYPTLVDAITAAGSETTTIEVIADTSIDSTIVIDESQNITLTGQKIMRGSEFAGYLFDVEGNLTLENITLDGDGENIEAQSALVGVGVRDVGINTATDKDQGILTIGEGAILTNNNNTLSHGSGSSTCFGGAVSNCGTVNMTAGTIESNVTTNANGGAVDNFGDFYMTGGIITKNDCVGVRNLGVFEASNATISYNTKGGIYTSESVTLKNCLIEYNKRSLGGGIYLQDYNKVDNGEITKTLTLIGTTVSNNTATGKYGGGVWCNGHFYMDENSVISYNSSVNQGGGVYGGGDFEIYGTITNNTSNAGGGVYNYKTNESSPGGNCLIGSSAVIENNEAISSSGGGVCSWNNESLTLEAGCTIQNNSAVTSAGGVYVDGTLTNYGANITGNTVNGAEDNLSVYNGNFINGNKTYSSLEKALVDAEPGETIEISSGTYDEDIVVDKAITLKGGEDVVFTKTIKITADGATLDGINLKYEGGRSEAIGNVYGNVWIQGNNITVKNCELYGAYDDTVTGIGGEFGLIWIPNSNTNIVLDNCNIQTNTMGIFPAMSTGVINNCTFSPLENDTRRSMAINYTGMQDVDITNNTFNGVRILTNGNITVTGNQFYDFTSSPIYTNYFSDGAVVDISNNYWGTENPDLDTILGTSGKLTLSSYYSTVNEDGSLADLVYIQDAADIYKSVMFEQVLDDNGNATNQIDVYLNGYTNDTREETALIENLVAVDLTFALSDLEEGENVEIIDFTPAIANWVIEEKYEGSGRYLIREEGGADEVNDASGTSIKLGTLTLGGYGTGTISITGDTNLINQRIDDNIVESTEVAGEIGNFQINVPKNTLAVNIDFNNSISDNASAYQDMTATISGGDLEAPIVKKFGSDEENGSIALSDNSYSFTEDLAENTAYTVTIEGEGYRTARYTVTMTGDKTLNFWNNVKDTATVVEIGNDSSMATVNYLAGDIVMNNVIDIYDLSAVVSYFGTTNDVTAESDYAKYDLNRDGKIDSKDVAMVLVSWGK